MANPTTNFGWVMPTSTDLVTDLPADFAVFGQGVDTSFQYLNGGTTGQILSKTSNTNLAFTWVTPTDQTPLTTKGDLFTFTTVDARLGVGSNGQILSADSTAATGLAWVTPNPGDITAVNVTSPITGGGTSGDVTIGFDQTAANTLTFNAQTGTGYTLVLADAANKLVTTSNASAVTVTIPPSVFSTGQQINVQSIGVGLTSFAAGSGVTITSTGASAAAPILRARYSAATVICNGSNSFTVIGDLS